MGREQKREPRGIPKGMLPASAQQLLDDMVTGSMTPEAVQDAFMLLKKALIERALGAELGQHLGYQSGQSKPESGQNQHNGSSAKTVLTDTGPVRLDIPRDRDGSFAPILIPKHERRFTGLDDKIIAMYARGMSVYLRWEGKERNNVLPGLLPSRRNHGILAAPGILGERLQGLLGGLGLRVL